MNNFYEELLTLLESSKDNSKDDLVILSSDLLCHTKFLDEIGIVYETQSEGIRIDLSAQKFKLFKKKQDSVSRLSINDLDKTILVIENHLIFYKDSKEPPIFFENIFFWHKIKELLIKEEICTHDDNINRAMIFLSEKFGKVYIGYKNRWIDDFYDKDHKLKNTYESLKDKISNNSEFKSFFKNNFLRIAQKISEPDYRYTETLKSCVHIMELSEIDFELFKNNFSFEEFKTELDKEQEKYFKDYQATISDFLSKISSMPLQFGAYIFLVFRFTEELLPLALTFILIISWSIFTIRSVNQILDNTIYIKQKFNSNFDELKSKIPVLNTEKLRSEVNEKFDKTIKLIKCYRITESVFTICILIICLYFAKIHEIVGLLKIYIMNSLN